MKARVITTTIYIPGGQCEENNTRYLSMGMPHLMYHGTVCNSTNGNLQLSSPFFSSLFSASSLVNSFLLPFHNSQPTTQNLQRTTHNLHLFFPSSSLPNQRCRILLYLQTVKPVTALMNRFSMPWQLWNKRKKKLPRMQHGLPSIPK
jgi:hypothetical protein